MNSKILYLPLIAALYLGSCLNLTAQTTIKGTVKDSLNNPIPFANVTLKDSDSSILLAYSYTTELGEYLLEVKDTGSYNLVFGSLSFKQKTIPLDISGNDKEIVINAVLTPEIISLNDVILEKTRPTVIKKDTIVFDAAAFARGNETVIEDLLKNIPGLVIEDDGTIKVNNQEIEKVMIDYDDFFEKGYKLLTKNLDAKVVDKVEVLKRYSNNRLLKGIEESNRVALNLKLKEEYKNLWFGSSSLNYGLASENRYEARNNLVNLGKKNKYYVTSNVNNIGLDAIGDIYHLIYSARYGEPGSIGDGETANSLLSMEGEKPNLKDSRTNFNNAEMVSLNSIFSLNDKTKLKWLGFLNWDENGFFKDRTETFLLSENPFTNNESKELVKKKLAAFSKVELIHNISSTKMLEYVGRFTVNDFNSNNRLLFNALPTRESLNEENRLTDQKLVYSNKFKENATFLITGRYIHEKKPQWYNIDVLLYPDLFPEVETIESVSQQSDNQMEFYAIESHLLNRKPTGSLLEMKAGITHRADKLISSFTLNPLDREAIFPEPFQNNVKYQTTTLFALARYRYQFKRLAITGSLNAQQLFNHLNNNGSFRENVFLFQPDASLEFKINNKNKITGSYSYSIANATILDVYGGFILTGSRTFNQGTGNFNQLPSSNLSLNYELGNWADRFFAFFSLYYKRDHDFFSTNALVDQNYNLISKILVNDRSSFGLNSNADYFIKKISSNLKLNIGYTSSNFKNILNNISREVSNQSYNYGFSFRSAFSGFFNYHAGARWTTFQVETSSKFQNTINKTFLDFSFSFTENFNATIASERYLFSGLEAKNNPYYFIDTKIVYNPKKSNLTFNLSGYNLLNTTTFTDFNITDTYTSSTEYRLLPRFILLGINFNF